MAKQLLEEVLQHALVREALRHGVLEEMRVDPFGNLGLPRHLFHNLLHEALRVVGVAKPSSYNFNIWWE